MKEQDYKQRMYRCIADFVAKRSFIDRFAVARRKGMIHITFYSEHNKSDGELGVSMAVTDVELLSSVGPERLLEVKMESSASSLFKTMQTYPR